MFRPTWSWVIVFSAFICYAITGGIERSFGVWYVELLDKFEAGATVTSSVIGLHVTVRLFVFPIAAVLIKWISVRIIIMIGGSLMCLAIFSSSFAESIDVFILTFGIIGGAGSGFISFGMQIAIVEYCKGNKAVAFGLASCGCGAGNFMLTPLLTYLFEEMSYFETVTIVAGISLHATLGGAVTHGGYKTQTKQQNDEERIPLMEQNVTEKSPLRRENTGFAWSIFSNPLAVLFMIEAVVFMLGSFPTLQLVVDFAIEKGETLEKASLLLIISGFVEVTARTCSGILFTIPLFRPYLFHGWTLCYVIIGVAILCIGLSQSFGQFVPCVAIYAICYNVIQAFGTLVFSDIFQKDVFPSIFALYNNMMGFGCLGGSILTGYMKDSSGSYVDSYLIMSGMCFATAVIAVTCLILTIKFRKTGKFNVIANA